jgi:putative endonuclease
MTDTIPVVETNQRAKGRLGEDAAAEYLVGQGYTIVARNYQSKQGEIDIIARDSTGVHVFVEVKASFGGGMGNPLFRITRAKQLGIIRLARRWLHEHDLNNAPCRFDAIGIQGGTIDHLKNAYLG